MIKKVLIANRGEIARRIIRTAHEMGIKTVALYTPEEENGPWVKEANEAICFNESVLDKSYLNIDSIIEFAKQLNADAIHPGYGFLSENATFAKKAEDEGIAFVGPTSGSIEAMGNKLNASDFARKAGVPVQKMFKGDKDFLASLKDELQYPVLIKAAAGGGGKGMKKVYDAESFMQALEQTAREAKSYFGNDEIYVEPLLTNARHIEVQVIGDGKGNAIHLGERDCTMQRRHQKVIEEAPAAILSDKQREEVTTHAVNLAKFMNYRSAGTVEFLFDENGSFWFLEMNTRIQVEHPVTEMVTGIDIVRWQFMIASGLQLAIAQEDVHFKGHAIEARLYAEKPHKGFLPDAGPVYDLSFPQYDWLRIDSSIEQKGVASPNFDPMIAKISVYGNDRFEAVRRLDQVLNNTFLAGVETNKAFLSALLEDEFYLNNTFHTQYIEQSLDYNPTIGEAEKYMAAHLIVMDQSLRNGYSSIWNTGYYRQVGVAWNIKVEDEVYCLYWENTNKGFKFEYNNSINRVSNISIDSKSVSFYMNSKKYEFSFFKYRDRLWIYDQSKTIRTERLLPKSGKKNIQANGRQLTLEAPMFGKILSINALEGTDIKEGDTLLVLESMKMENHLQATGSAKVKNILVHEGDQVADGQILMEFE
jgi:3-methylcrotonyl-CoA carboxylase alpha subunit